MDEETSITISILMEIDFIDKKEKFREGEGYNMCQAIQEMVDEGRMEGLREGRKEEHAAGIRILIQMNRDDGIEENEIMFKLKKYYLLSEEEARNALKRNL